jgi:hypothetical protein
MTRLFFGARLSMLALALGMTACATARVPKHPSSSRGCGAEAFSASHGQCVPNAWFCSPMFYNAGSQDGCDCDCGAPDPDCVAGAVRWCEHAGQPVAVDGCEACVAPGPSPAPSP